MRRLLMGLVVVCLSTASNAQNPPKDLVGNWSGAVRSGGMSPERPASGTMGAALLQVGPDGSIVLWQNVIQNASGEKVMKNPATKPGESGYDKLTPLSGTKVDFTDHSVHFIVHWNTVRSVDFEWTLEKKPDGVVMLSARQLQADPDGKRPRNVSGPVKRL